MQESLHAFGDVKAADTRVQICDLGLAVELEASSASVATDKLAGTEIYMAPELFDADGCYSFKSDVWRRVQALDAQCGCIERHSAHCSFGVVVYEMFFSEIPYRMDDVNAVQKAVRSGALAQVNIPSLFVNDCLRTVMVSVNVDASSDDQ